MIYILKEVICTVYDIDKVLICRLKEIKKISHEWYISKRSKLPRTKDYRNV